MQTATAQKFPHVPAGAGETYNVIGELLTFKVMNEQTDGAFTVVELQAQAGGGPPLHTHPSSESFTILEGEFQFTGLNEGTPYTVRALPGDTVFIPGGAPHAYTVVSDSSGKTLLVFTPGTEMERFFKEAGWRVAPGKSAPSGPPDIQSLIAIGQTHGLEFLPPSQ